MNRLRIRNHWLSESRGGGGIFLASVCKRPGQHARICPSAVLVVSAQGFREGHFLVYSNAHVFPPARRKGYPETQLFFPSLSPRRAGLHAPGEGAQRRLPSYLVLCSVKPRTG